MTIPSIRPVRACALPFALLLAPAAGSQQPTDVFHAPTVVLGVDSPPFQRLLDVDGDGDLDAIGSRCRADGQAADIAAWRNDQGVFTEAFRITLAIPTHGMLHMPCAVGDFDGNGRPDAAFVAGANIVQVLGRPGFAPAVTTTPVGTGRVLTGVAAADFDGDGRDDLAVLDYGTWRSLEVRTTTWTPRTFGLPALTHAAGPMILEADGDARPEVAVVLDGRILQPIDVGPAALAALPQLSTTLSPGGAYHWVAGDVDNDGRSDVVVFKPQSGQSSTFQTFRHDGTRLRAEAEALGGPAEYLVDVDGDGRLDGVCCGSGGGGTNQTWPKLDFASTFEIALGDGNGGFAMAYAFPGSGSRSMAGAADLDGDGDVDLVAGRVVFHGRGPWREHPLPPTGYNAALLRPWFLHDPDRDGDLDLLPNPYGGSLGAGDGTFVTWSSPGVTPPAGRYFVSGPMVDHDGDGAADHLVQQFRTGGPFEHMVLLRNNGGGHYTYGGPVTAAGVRIGFGYTVDHTLTADLDGDGDLDVVANSNPTYDNYRSEVFWRQGNDYVPGPVFATSRIDGVADFDGDGLPDLLMSNSTNYLLARGTGSAAMPFATPQVLAMHFGFAPKVLRIADFDDDGRPDLLLPIVPPMILWNRTTAPGPVLFGGSMGLSGLLPAADARVTTGDFDGDSRTDLVIGPLSGEPNVSALLLRTTASAPNVNPTLNDYTVRRLVLGDGFAGDMDGDGDLDLVGTVAVRNARWHGLGAGLRRQYGRGTVGEASAVPLLGVHGVLRTGHTATLALNGVPGPTLAALDLALAPANVPGLPLPGLTLYLDQTTLLISTVSIGASGGGRAAAGFRLPVPLQPGFAGLSFYLQMFVLDPASPTVITASNGLRITVGT